MSVLRKGKLRRRGGLAKFVPSGLAPQKVVEVDGADPTRDTYQRKVFYDGSNFVVVYWDLGDDKDVYYVASSDGETWTARTSLWSFSVAPYYGGNVDIQYPNRGALNVDSDPYDVLMVFSGSNGSSWYAYPFTIDGQTLTQISGTSIASGDAQGGRAIASLKGDKDFWAYHRTAYLAIGYLGTLTEYTTDISYGGTSTGGVAIYPYKTASPYKNVVIAKDSNDKLHSNILNEACTSFEEDWTEIATLGTGFSDFCACSEAQAAGDPEKVHLVYIKSTGQLCYRKFEDDEWSNEKVLVGSGASYPVIAAGDNGRLYVFYVSGGEIHVIHYDGNWLKSVELFTADHTYDTPVYLSCNQNVQNGKICLCWTEGTSSPYEVWFCYLND